MKQILHSFILAIVLLYACTPSKKIVAPINASKSAITNENIIAQSAESNFFDDSILANAHIGIAVYDRELDASIYRYQANKFFIPASNTKLFTCYAAMKYLSDSLTTFRYVLKPDDVIEVEANGDPTFLHPDYSNHHVIGFLSKFKKVLLTNQNWKSTHWGKGWSWDDYQDDYMTERSLVPIFGNVLTISNQTRLNVSPNYFRKPLLENLASNSKKMMPMRELATNTFTWQETNSSWNNLSIPFVTTDTAMLKQVLQDTLKTVVEWVNFKIDRWSDVIKLVSQPTDSMLRPMMLRSDNFFAEQSLLMVSNELLEEMNTSKIIDTLLKTSLKKLPQKPKWVDGSGLSRYNLFSPDDFIFLLNKMQNEFKWERINGILAGANEGTLQGYYKNYEGKIFAKTGTLSNNIALSGYLITNSNKRLCFSIMINNHQVSNSLIRKKMENFLTTIIDKY